MKSWERDERIREDGIEEGLQKGRREAMDNMSTLILQLLSLGRIEDIKRASEDENAREQLFKEFNIV